MDDGANHTWPDRTAPDGVKTPGPTDFKLFEYDETGIFARPVENTWAAHDQIIRASKGILGFNTQTYDYFDGVIAEKLGRPALTNEKHADYAGYDALRGNIAVLRNFLLLHYEQAGDFAQDKELPMARMRSIAESLGQALANDTWGARAITRSASLDIANIDGVGAMEMYKHLLDIQETPAIRQPMISGLKFFLAIPDRDWALAPLEQSPFHPSALAAPPPGFVGMELPKPEDNGDYDADAQSRDNGNAKPQDQIQSTDEELAITEQAVRIAGKLYSIDTLAEAPREESIEEARKILRNLRNMEFTDRNMEEFLDHGTPTAIVAKKQAFTRLTEIFSAHVRHAQHKNPASINDPAIQQARDTTATIALELAEHTRRRLREEDEREHRINRLIDMLPREAEMRVTQSVARLLETFELGLERASGKEIATTGLERLLLAEERMEQHAVLLEDPKTGEVPTREESIALARDILRRMHELPFGHATLQEFVDNGKPEEQAAFAQGVEELSEIYRNLMLEAAQFYPDVVQDPRVKQANDVVSSFAHAVKLMAAKEMPTSIAATQQISAEAAREPEQWKDLHNHTVERLIETAEGGLEKAMEELASDAEEQEEDLAAEIIAEAAAQTDHHHHRRKRRRDSIKRSVKGFKKQLRKLLDITADDRVLKQGRFAEEQIEITREPNESAGKSVNEARAARLAVKQTQTRLAIEADDRLLGEGRFANEKPVLNTSRSRKTSTNEPNRQQSGRPATPVAPPKGLKESDLAAISKLGSSLRGIGNQLQGVSVTNVGADKPAPQKPNDREPNTPRNNGKGNGFNF